MRRIIKKPDSMIATQELSYEKHKTQIKEVLLQEQNYFCAYTDDRISPAFAKDIEHFNPTLKTTDADNYHNWFMVSHEWNMHKGTKNAISR
jgi:CRISPR/Cas system Type II protein with McrA/HNH and RuvC-like nuclease domain